MIELEDVSKTFTLHNQGSAVIEVIRKVSFRVEPGECVALTGASGAGKSTLMRMIHGNYLAASGRIMVGGTDVARAQPREILALRREVLGYVSQFLRVVPRVAPIDVVAEPLVTLGVDPEAALRRANAKFTRRFERIEDLLKQRGKSPEQSDIAEMDALWDQAKAEERSNPSA